MTHPQIIHGITEEEDFGDSPPAPPNTVCDLTHLEELLLEGLASPQEAVTDQEWVELRREVNARLAKI